MAEGYKELLSRLESAAGYYAKGTGGKEFLAEAEASAMYDVCTETADAITKLLAEREALRRDNDVKDGQIFALKDQAKCDEAERDALREALKPFAKWAGEFDAATQDSRALVGNYEDPNARRIIVTYGDLRRARAALQENQQ